MTEDEKYLAKIKSECELVLKYPEYSSVKLIEYARVILVLMEKQ